MSWLEAHSPCLFRYAVGATVPCWEPILGADAETIRRVYGYAPEKTARGEFGTFNEMRKGSIGQQMSEHCTTPNLSILLL